MVAIPDILKRRKSQKQFRSQPVYNQPIAKVDREAGIIQAVQIVREGEAKGHGVNLDSEFVTKIAELGTASKIGIKSRFNHPNMSASALGTMIGTFHNFNIKGTAAYADLHLSETAKTSPQGDLYTYVLDMAENESEHFGNSIAFSDDGNLYVKNKEGEKKKLHFESDGFSYTVKVVEGEELVDYDLDEYSGELYVLPAALHASDLVDDPAATDGLFSANVNGHTFAVQATAFLDAHPEIWGFVERHPDKLEPFFEKYQAYCERKGARPKPKMSKKKPNLFQRLFAAFKTGGTFDISVTDTEGNALSIVTESDEPAVGDAVTVVGEAGETQPADDGNYVVASGEFEGQTITVADGTIADITEAETDDAAEGTEDIPAQEVSMSALQKKIKRLEAENAKLKKRPAADHTDLEGEQDHTRGKVKTPSYETAGQAAFERGKRLRRP